MKPRVAFLTGQSDPERCALSPQQSGLMAELEIQAEGIDCVALNYPWRADTAAWRPVPLWRASLANARQYLAARRGSEPTLRAARAWLLQAPRSLLLVGSCGLSLLDALLWGLEPAERSRIRAVAFGAVGPIWPSSIRGHVLQGRRDWIARLLGPPALASEGVTTQALECGHMDYLQRNEARVAVLAAACAQLQWLRGMAPALSAHESADDASPVPCREAHGGNRLDSGTA